MPDKKQRYCHYIYTPLNDWSSPSQGIANLFFIYWPPQYWAVIGAALMKKFTMIPFLADFYLV